mgnify:CR=1 FL=1
MNGKTIRMFPAAGDPTGILIAAGSVSLGEGYNVFRRLLSSRSALSATTEKGLPHNAAGRAIWIVTLSPAASPEYHRETSDIAEP